MPGTVAAQLVNPSKTPAWFGAMSMWLTLNPEWVSPSKPPASDRTAMTAATLQPKNDTVARHVPAKPNAV